MIMVRVLVFVCVCLLHANSHRHHHANFAICKSMYVRTRFSAFSKIPYVIYNHNNDQWKQLSVLMLVLCKRIYRLNEYIWCVVCCWILFQSTAGCHTLPKVSSNILRKRPRDQFTGDHWRPTNGEISNEHCHTHIDCNRKWSTWF